MKKHFSGYIAIGWARENIMHIHLKKSQRIWMWTWTCSSAIGNFWAIFHQMAVCLLLLCHSIGTEVTSINKSSTSINALLRIHITRFHNIFIFLSIRPNQQFTITFYDFVVLSFAWNKQYTQTISRALKIRRHKNNLTKKNIKLRMTKIQIKKYFSTITTTTKNLDLICIFFVLMTCLQDNKQLFC